MNWLTLLGLLCLPGSLFSFVEYLRSQRLVQQLSTTRLLKVAELRNLGQTSPQAKGANLAQVYGRVVSITSPRSLGSMMKSNAIESI